MPSPHSKVVTEATFVRIAQAIDQVAADPALKRTKRQIEALTGLSHDAVQRAFKQDHDSPTSYRISDRFSELLRAVPKRGDSLQAAARREEREETSRERAKVRELEAQVERLSIALYAAYLRDEEGRGQTASIVPIRRADRERDGR